MTVSVFSSKSMLIQFISRAKYDEPISMAARSKAWVCGRLLAGIVDSNPVGGMDVSLSDVCDQVGVSASSRSLAQRSPTECGVSECDHEVP
jgi:hypothetical protein